MGLSKECLVPRASGSCDMQGPIEWSHGLVKEKLSNYLYTHSTGKMSPQRVKRLWQKLWLQWVTPEQVQRDFNKLPSMYRTIINLGGGWIGKLCTP